MPMTLSQRLMPSLQRKRVFVVDLRLPERRCQLDEVEQASVKLIKEQRLRSCATSRRQQMIRLRQFATVAFTSPPN